MYFIEVWRGLFRHGGVYRRRSWPSGRAIFIECNKLILVDIRCPQLQVSLSSLHGPRPQDLFRAIPPHDKYATDWQEVK